MTSLELLDELYPQLKKSKWLPDWKDFWQYFALLIIATIIFIIVLGFILSVGAIEITPLSVAQSQIGLGEIGGNNKGQYVRQYLNGQEGLPWCAGFISYCFKKAGYNLPYFLRAKSYLKIGKQVEYPQAGDLVIFSRKNGCGHIGIIEKVDNYSFISIEGNLGNFPAEVKRIEHLWFGDENILGFIRLSKVR